MICPICSSDDFQKELDTKDYFLTGEAFELKKCSCCGLVVTDNAPAEEATGKYYESKDYVSHNDEAKGIVNVCYKAVRRFMLKRKKSYVVKATKQAVGSVLDMGSGTGHFLSVMKKAGWQVKGMEINAGAKDYSEKKFGLDVISPYQIGDLPSSSFDCITLWHVLEHLNVPVKYLEEAVRLLKPEGVCVIALPNCASFDADFYKQYWAGYDVPRHLWHFTPDTFGKIADKTGLDLFRIKKLPFDVFYIAILSERYKGSRHAFLSGLIKGLWFWLKTVFCRKKSSSLLYFLKKK